MIELKSISGLFDAEQSVEKESPSVRSRVKAEKQKLHNQISCAIEQHYKHKIDLEIQIYKRKLERLE